MALPTPNPYAMASSWTTPASSPCGSLLNRKASSSHPLPSLLQVSSPLLPFARFIPTPQYPVCLLTLQKTSFRGLTLGEAKCHPSILFLPVRSPPSPSTNASRRLDISARTAGAAKTIEVEVDKPLGLTLGQKPGGGVVISVSCSLASIPPWGRLLIGRSVLFLL